MKRVSVKLEEDRVQELDSIADDDGVSRSEVIRDLLDDGLNNEDDERVQELEKRITELETENDRLRNEKRLILEQKEENQELVEYVEQERTLTERKASAGVVTRAKWWLVGMPEE